jgi:hypothetical protein
LAALGSKNLNYLRIFTGNLMRIRSLRVEKEELSGVQISLEEVNL